MSVLYALSLFGLSLRTLSSIHDMTLSTIRSSYHKARRRLCMARTCDAAAEHLHVQENQCTAARSFAGADAADCASLPDGADPAGCTCDTMVGVGQEACPPSPAQDAPCVCLSSNDGGGEVTIDIANCFTRPLDRVFLEYEDTATRPQCIGIR